MGLRRPPAGPVWACLPLPAVRAVWAVHLSRELCRGDRRSVVLSDPEAACRLPFFSSSRGTARSRSSLLFWFGLGGCGRGLPTLAARWGFVGVPDRVGPRECATVGGGVGRGRSLR